MNSVWLTGMVTGLALIVAIGAQNAFLLRQGIRREHVWTAVAISIVSDVLLISLGTVGVGFLVEQVPWLLEVFRWGGVVYLLVFAFLSFRSAFTSHGLEASEGGGSSLRSVVVTAIALTWLNPHAYLDAVIMLGNLANQHGDERWTFTGGAITASVLWFLALGAGSTALSKVLNTPLTWRVVDILVGIIMLFIAITLAVTPSL